METIDELVPRVRDTLRGVADGEGVLVFADGRIEVAPGSVIEAPDTAGGDAPVARFPFGQADLPPQEIRDRIRAGMAKRDRPPMQAG